MHVWDSDSSLHRLQNLALLENGELAGLLFLLALIAFEKHILIVLGVDGQIEEVLVVAGHFPFKPEPAYKPNFDGLHGDYGKWDSLNIITIL